MSAKRRTFIRCEDGHVIGEIVLDRIHQAEVSALYVYRESIEKADDVPENLPTRQSLSFGFSKHDCTICKKEVAWGMTNRVAITLVTNLLNGLYEPAKFSQQMVKEQE